MKANELRMRNGQAMKSFRFATDPELNVWVPCMAEDLATMKRDA